MSAPATTTSGKLLLARWQEASSDRAAHIVRAGIHGAALQTLCGRRGGLFTTWPGRRDEAECKMCKRRLGKG